MYTAAADTAAVTGTNNWQWRRQAKQASYYKCKAAAREPGQYTLDDH